MANPTNGFQPFRRQQEDPHLEARIRVIEEALLRLGENQYGIVDPITGQVVASGAQGSGSSGGGGGGGGGGSVASSGLLDDAYHVDTVTAAPVRGDVITAQGSPSLWTRLAIGLSGRYIRSDGTDASWAQVAFTDIAGTITAAQHGNLASTAGSTADHSGTLTANARLLAQKNGVTVGSARPTFNFIEGTGITLTVSDTGTVVSITVASDGSVTAHNLLSSSHGDTLTASVTRGAVLVGNSTPKWSLLTIGTANKVLKSDGTDAAWNFVAFSEVTGTLTNTQHGNLASTAGATADHTGTLSANARTAIKKNGTLVATRRGVNFIEGSNVTITVTDDSGNEEVDVTFAQTSVSAATVIVKEAGSVVSAAATTLDFGDGFDVTESPLGEANVTHDLSEVVTGDVSFSTNAGTVTAVRGKNVPNPSGSEDQKFPRYNNATTAFIWSTLSDLVTGDVSFVANTATVAKIQTYPIQVIPGPLNGVLHSFVPAGDGTNNTWYARDTEINGWSRNNIANASSAASMPRIGAGGNNINAPWIPHKAGILTGVSIGLVGDVGAAGTSYTVEVYKNASATGVLATVTGGASTESTGYTASIGGSFVSFAAGDKIELRDSKSGSVTTTDAQASLFICWKQTDID